MQNPYLRTCVLGNSTRQMHVTKEMTSNNTTSERVSYSGPIMKKRNHSRLKDNAAPKIPCSYRAGQSVADTVGSNQLIMDQQRENLRTFNRADTMDNSKRQMKIPNDPSWVSESFSLTSADKKLSFTLHFGLYLSVFFFVCSMILRKTKCTCRVHCWLNQAIWIKCWKNMTGSSRSSPDRGQNNQETESCVSKGQNQKISSSLVVANRD